MFKNKQESKDKNEPKTLGGCYDLSPRSRRKAMNRLYCKENRRKKKEYVKELEEKIINLEAHIESLKNQIDKYKYKLNISIIGGVKDLDDFSEAQEIRRKETIKCLEEGKKEDELKHNIKQFGNTTGLACKDRQRLIRAAIRVVVENIVPNRLRVLFNLVKNATNDASLEDIKKLYKMDLKNFEIESKKPKYCEIDRLHYHTKVDPNLHFRFKTNDNFKALLKFKEEFQSCIHALIKTKNKIINLQYDFKRYDDPDRFELTSENVIRFYKFTKKLEHDEKYDIFNTWNIKKAKKANKEDYRESELSMVELSDSDNCEGSEFEGDDEI